MVAVGCVTVLRWCCDVMAYGPSGGVAALPGQGLHALRHVCRQFSCFLAHCSEPTSCSHVHACLQVATSGIITTVVGDVRYWKTPVGGFVGDGGPATLANLNAPSDLVVAANGDLIICDTK